MKEAFQSAPLQTGVWVTIFLLATGPAQSQTSLTVDEGYTAQISEENAPDHSLPVREDDYSGKTVSSWEMGYKMIANRIYFAPRPGEFAPDFNLLTLDGKERVSLYQLCAEKPVVLIYGSWGCDILRETTAGLLELYHRYQDKAHFVFVYIREAHPLENFEATLGRTNDSRTIQQRIETAKRCKEQLRLPFLFLVDDMMDSNATRWGAWPVRTFVVEKGRQIGYAGGQGPWLYRPYRGYQHGNGAREGLDLKFSEGTLEDYLEKRFASSRKFTTGTSGSER